MEQKQIEQIHRTTRRRLAMEVNETIRRMQESFPDSPESMQYFLDHFQKLYCEGELFGKEKQKIGIMCLQVPEELIYAVDAVPVRLCNGSYAYDQVGSDFMPARSCSVVKSTLGMLQVENPTDAFSLVVIPTTCDQKKKAGALLEDMGIRTYMLELPPRKDTELARYYWQNSVKEFALELQKITGRKIGKNALLKSLATINRARTVFRKLLEYRRHTPAIISGTDALLITNAYFTDDIEQWTTATEKLNQELQKRLEYGLSIEQGIPPRLLITGSPPIFPNLKVPMMVEEIGAVVVIDEVCSSTRLLYDMPAFEEPHLYDMIPAIADRYLKPCTCPCFASNNDRLRKLESMISEYCVDGVIYQAFSGCQLYEMEQKLVNNHLKQLGIPMLYIETDYSPEDSGQISTRLEAFVESIKDRKRRN